MVLTNQHIPYSRTKQLGTREIQCNVKKDIYSRISLKCPVPSEGTTEFWRQIHSTARIGSPERAPWGASSQDKTQERPWNTQPEKERHETPSAVLTKVFKVLSTTSCKLLVLPLCLLFILMYSTSPVTEQKWECGGKDRKGGLHLQRHFKWT